MPKGRVVYVPEAAQGRLTFLGQEIPIRVEDVASDACQPGTRVRSDMVWEDEDLRASKGPLKNVISGARQGDRRAGR